MLRYRVESGPDDPGNLDQFFGGSNGSQPQTKLSGCDQDITCSLEISVGTWWVNYGSDECRHCNITGVKPAYYLKLFAGSIWYPKVSSSRSRKSLQGTDSVSCQDWSSINVMLLQHVVTSGSHPGCSVGQWVNRCDPFLVYPHSYL